MRKSIAKRISITKKGKIRRRAGGLGHSKANKSGKQLTRKKGVRSLDLTTKVTKRFIAS